MVKKKKKLVLVGLDGFCLWLSLGIQWDFLGGTTQNKVRFFGRIFTI